MCNKDDGNCKNNSLKSKTRSPKEIAEIKFRILLKIIKRKFGVKKHDLISKNNYNKQILNSRQIAIYVARVGLGVDIKAVAEKFQRDRRTVSRICSLIEEQRENFHNDKLISEIESDLCNELQKLGI